MNPTREQKRTEQNSIYILYGLFDDMDEREGRRIMTTLREVQQQYAITISVRRT